MRLKTVSPTIRDYRDADLDTVAEVWLRSWQSTGIAAPVTLDELRSRLLDGLACGWIIHVAANEHCVVGFVAFCGDRLEQLFVAPEWQSRGIGKTLLDCAKNRMPGGFRLHAAAESRAVRFYEREGLSRGETGAHPRFGHMIVTYSWRP
jgi:GNAT superfamily N-acetyltransferase